MKWAQDGILTDRFRSAVVGARRIRESEQPGWLRRMTPQSSGVRMSLSTRAVEVQHLTCMVWRRSEPASNRPELL